MAEASSARERLAALDHLSPRDAAKAWGVPKSAVTQVATRIKQERDGRLGRLPEGRDRCDAPVTSWYGLPCQVAAEFGYPVCAYHLKSAAYTHLAPITDETVATVKAELSLEAVRERVLHLDKRALRSAQLQLRAALKNGETLSSDDYRLASILLPSEDPATQARREVGFPGPNDGIGDAERLYRLGRLLAGIEQLHDVRFGERPAELDSTPQKLCYSSEEASELLGISKSWLSRQAASNRIPCRRFGRQVRFSKEDLDAIIGKAEVPVVQYPRGRRRSR